MQNSLVNAGLFVLLAACSQNGGGGSDGSDVGTGSSGTVSCEADSRAMSYSADLTVMGATKTYQIALVEGDPAPPARGTNTWVIKVLDASGKPVSNPMLTVKPFMPDHGHGTQVEAVIKQQEDGSYSVTPLYLFMPGLWQVTFGVHTATGDDSVVFSFCIEG
jgi:hypothetical protein